jgi:hypothetical protein
MKLYEVTASLLDSAGKVVDSNLVTGRSGVAALVAAEAWGTLAVRRSDDPDAHVEYNVVMVDRS